MQGHLKEETHFARQLYLFGAGNDAPIKNLQRLSEKSGCPLRTIRDHVKGWRQEAENLAIRSDTSPYSIALSTETLEHHRKHVDFLKKQVDKLGRMVKALPIDSQSYLIYMDSYVKALTKWEKASGIQAHQDAVAGAMREAAKTAARVKAKQDDGAPKKARVIDRSKFDVDG